MRPAVFKIALAALCLPLAAYPALISRCPDDRTVEIFVWAYPVYVVLAAVCAWYCRPQRKELAWIILALLALTHIAIWLLVTTPQNPVTA